MTTQTIRTAHQSQPPVRDSSPGLPSPSSPHPSILRAPSPCSDGTFPWWSIALLLSALFLLMTSGHLSAQQPSFITNGLVAYYPFNGNANDESGFGRNGTVFGATLATDRFGKPGSAFAFANLPSYIEVTNSLHPQGEVTLTYSCWEWQLNTSAESLITVGSFHPHEDFIPNSVSGLFIERSYATLYYLTGAQNCAAENSTTVQEWHHVALTKTGVNVAFYLDGLLVAKCGLGSGQNVTSKDLFIGWNGNPYHNAQWYGSIDDVRIYNRAFSDSEIKALYVKGGPIVRRVAV